MQSNESSSLAVPVLTHSPLTVAPPSVSSNAFGLSQHRKQVEGVYIVYSNVCNQQPMCVMLQLQYRLSATGVRGSLEITRVDWDQYKLKYKLKGDKRSTSKSFRVAGVQNEFRAFLNLVGDWRAGIIPQMSRKENQMQNPPSPLTPSPSKVRSRFSSEVPVGPDKVSMSEDGALREGQEPLPELRGRPEEGFWDLALAAAIIESGDSGATTKVPDL